MSTIEQRRQRLERSAEALAGMSREEDASFRAGATVAFSSCVSTLLETIQQHRIPVPGADIGVVPDVILLRLVEAWLAAEAITASGDPLAGGEPE